MNRCATVLFVISILVSTLPATAGITTTGSIDPNYDGTDPWILSSNLLVGQSGDATVVVAGGSQVLDGSDTGQQYGTYIASDPNATASVTVTGAGSAWDSTVMVGQYGNGTMRVADGARMATGGVSVGHEPNSVGDFTLTGAGTTLEGLPEVLYSMDDTPPVVDPNGPPYLYVSVGAHGTGSLTVSDGAQVTAEEGRLYLGHLPGGVGSLTVTGPNSVWDQAGPAYIGYYGTGTLEISDGAVMTSGSAQIGGYSAVRSAGGQGSVLVTDPNSIWRTDGLTVGGGGPGELTISAGGRVESGSATVSAGGRGEALATVTGQGSVWDIENGLVVGYGMTDGHDSLYGDLVIEEGGRVTTANAYVGYGSGSEGQVDIDDPNSLWANSGTLHVGYAGQGVVSVGTGGRMTSAAAVIGTEATGDGAVDVSHSGSQWVNTGNLEIGRGGTGGLVVDFGGEAVTENATLAVDPNSTAVLSVSGAGSVFEVQDTLNVGSGGEANVYVSGGGQIDSNDVFLAQEAGGTAMVSVADANSLWSAIDLFDVGVRGEAALTISDGGQVTASGTGVGVKPGSAGTVIVTGDGSLWQVAGGLTIGVAGQGALVVSDSGRVEANSIRIASEDSGPSSAMVTGAGSLLTAEMIVVHDVGALDVNDGGQVSSTEGRVSGAVQITGAGSTWTNSNDLMVTNASIVVSNGGRLITGRSSTSPVNGQTINIAVSGPGSLWDTGRLLFLTRDSHVGISVSDGGQITSKWVAIAETGAGMVDVTVTGAGSRWDAGGQLTIGSSGDDEIDTIVTVSDGGVVEVNNVTVWRGGALAGDGTFVVDGVANHGIIRPGNSIGTLTVDGDLTMEPNGVLEIEIDNEGNSDKLIVTGEYTRGYRNFRTIGTETITGSHSYTIVEANSVTSPLAITEVDGYNTALLKSYKRVADSNTVMLDVTALAFADANVAETSNQQSLGSALDAIAADGGNDVTTMLQQIVSGDDARAAYDQLSGQTRAPLAHASIAAGTRPMETVAGRMRDASRASSSGSQAARLDAGAGRYSFAVGNGTPYLGAEQWGIWGKFYGLYGDRETDGAEQGYQYSAYGGGFGIDYEVSENWLFGVTGGYWDGDVTFANSADTTAVTSTYAGLYGSYETSRWYADGVLTYSNLSYESTRYVALVGEQLEGDFDGRMFGGYVEAGLNWWRRANCLIQPLASLQVASVDIDSYTESGGAASLQYESEQYTSTKSGLGLKATRQFLRHADGSQLEVELRGRWLHEFGDTQSDIAVQFADAPTASFRVSDPELSRDSALLGAGFRARLGEATRLFVDYDTELGSDRNVQMFSAGLEYRW